MNKPIVFFDLEATGLDISKDRIIEIGMLKWGEQEEVFHTRINPGFPIPPESSEIHGITDADVKDKPKFADVADKIVAFLKGCDIGGYNCRNFDIPMLWEELYRCKWQWDMTNIAIIDVANIFKLQHPRDLVAAVKLYCKQDHEDAHSALADTAATADVYCEQLNQHPDICRMTRQELHQYCQMDERRVDLAGIIVLNKDGVPVFNTKRNKGVPVKGDQGYANWILRSDFSANTKLHIERILNEP